MSYQNNRKIGITRAIMSILVLFHLLLPSIGWSQDARVEKLIEELKSWDSHVHLRAAEALGEMRDKKAVEPLIAALKDESSYVRWNAAVALYEFSRKVAQDSILACPKPN